jgi:hypothetical protein
MTRWVTAALAVAVVCAAPLAAADQPKKPTGAWTKTEGDLTITFDIKAEGMTVALKGGDRKFEVTADYGVSKDGVLFGRVSKIVKENADGGPEEGDLFSFRFKVEKDKITLSELNSPKTNDDVKKLIEGDYALKTNDK